MRGGEECWKPKRWHKKPGSILSRLLAFGCLMFDAAVLFSERQVASDKGLEEAGGLQRAAGCVKDQRSLGTAGLSV